MLNSLIGTIFKDFYSPFKKPQSRVFLIDFLRFLAIVLMVIYHFTYDLNYFRMIKVDLHNGFWFILPRIIVTLFLISSGLSFGMKDWSNLSLKERFTALTPRMIKLAFYATAISIATYFVFPNNWIYFGTLHCFFACTLLSIFFLNHRKISLILGTLIVLAYITKFMGLKDPLNIPGFRSVDFIPLYPWFGVFLIGLGLSQFKSIYQVLSSVRSKAVSYTSQKTLPIYIMHQIILFGIAMLLAKIIR